MIQILDNLFFTGVGVMFSSGGVRPGQARLGKVRLPHHEITEIMMSAESGKFYWFIMTARKFFTVYNRRFSPDSLSGLV